MCLGSIALSLGFDDSPLAAKDMKLTTGTKLAIGFALLLIVMVSSSFVCFSKAEQVRDAYISITDVHAPGIDALRCLERDLLETASQTRRAILAGTRPAREADALAQFNSSWVIVEKDVLDLDRLTVQWPPDETQLFARLKSQLPRIHDIQKAAIHLSSEDGPASLMQAGDQYADRGNQALEKVAAELNELAAAHIDMLTVEKKKLDNAKFSLEWALILATLTALCAGIGLSFFSVRKASSTTKVALDRAEALARSVSSPEAQSSSRENLADLASAMNRMQESLTAVVQSILSSTRALAAAGEQIAAAASKECATVEEQRGQTRQIATAINEMASSIHKISEDAAKALDSIRKCAELARSGNKTVQDTLGKMGEAAASVGDSAQKAASIEKNSVEMGRIVAVIDELADGAQLAAFNAAIQAAHHRSDALGLEIATEISSLADRTSQITKDIVSTIQAVQADAKSAVQFTQAAASQVEAGVQSATVAGNLFQELAASSDAIIETLSQIAATGGRQSSAASEINANIDKVAVVADKTAESAQQSVKAGQELSSLALELHTTVKQFKLADLDDDDKSPSTPSASGVESAEASSKKQPQTESRAVPSAEPSPEPTRPVLRAAPVEAPSSPEAKSAQPSAVADASAEPSPPRPPEAGASMPPATPADSMKPAEAEPAKPAETEPVMSLTE